MSQMTREEIEKRPKALNDPWLSAAFAARITTLALPFLANGVERGKPFLWFWKEEKRHDYLLKVLRTWQCAWSASRFKNNYIGAAAYAAAAATSAVAAAAAYAVYARSASAASAAHTARAAFGNTAYAVYAAANANAADDAATYAADAKETDRHIFFFKKIKILHRF